MVTSTTEPEWDETEQGWMLALAVHRLNRCKGCGGDLRVTTLPENEEKFTPDLPTQCHRCVAVDRSHIAYEGEPHSRSFLHMVPLKPRR